MNKNQTDNLLKFLQSQKVLIIASIDNKDIWISNVYYGIDKELNFYFSSGKDSLHSNQILNNSNVAFSVVWYDSSNYKDRKGIQGKGKCTLVTQEKEIEKAISMHNSNFPEFKDRVTIGNITNPEFPSKIWKIRPIFIKYWDNELFGENGTKEFNF
ncbi:MAG: pyridoxamine 5'-phosphate oxidase family protein [Candidatus Woesearchaeota archaeon]